MRRLLYTLFFLACSLAGHSQQHLLTSPDGKTELLLFGGNSPSWMLKYNGAILVRKADFSMDLNGNAYPASGTLPKKISSKLVKERIESTVPVKFRSIEVSYTQALLKVDKSVSVEFRLYNEGFAYRFVTGFDYPSTVKQEDVILDFPENCRIFFPREEKLQSHYERIYLDTLLTGLEENSFASLPLLVQNQEGINLLITDADLYDYPCMFLQKAAGTSLRSLFPRAVLEAKPDVRYSDRQERVTREADYIAKTEGARSFPWRVFAIAGNDKDLLENQLVYNLSRTGSNGYDWIKPGKVAWDWWNDNNIYGVNYKSGINTETYRYYIDFAADYGLEYIILDEGWSATTLNLLESKPGMDIPGLVSYARSKNVDIILWVLWKPFYENMENVLNRFRQWGIAGIKVDFMQRADQQMVNIYEEIASKAAEYKMVVDFHGAFKPSGLCRKYPNVLSFEGVKGLENVKWSALITPSHNLTLPFIRMVAGPMDYTPGAMINKQKADYSISWSQPMAMGTRAHQVALYVVYESPLQMLCDNPSNYRKEEACTRFISQIPTVWDQTIALEGSISKYLVIARKHEDKWYLAALTDWEEREFDIDLAFLESGTWHVEVFQDGINANKHAEDFSLATTTANESDRLKIKLAKGGGFVAVFSPGK